MRNSTRWAAIAALLLLAPACGDDDDDASGDAATEETEASDDGGGGGDACETEETGEATVTIADFAFDPAELTVASGGVVTVSNDDSTTHTFTSADGGFDCEIASGDSANVLMPAAAGEYDFHCTIHPSMTGTLTIE